ncbi:MAG: tetratricopeptide repeat protein [Mariniphaga sp.]|nr:tetratricopeptide repeat protein [Mariniphaga sp.]
MTKLEKLLKQSRELNLSEEYDKTIELLSEEILKKYKSADLYAEKAQAYYKLKEFELCYETTEQALSLDPENAKANNYKANIYYDNKEYEKSKEYYLKAILIDPNYVQPYYNLGVLFKEQLEYIKAIDYYNKAILIDPKHVDAYIGIGATYYNLQKYDQAVDFYKKAIEVNPKFDPPYYNLGLVYLNTKNYTDSLKYFRQYIELTEKKPDYYTSLAKSKITELKKLIKSIEFSEISELVEKIKELLLFNEGNITHYTSLTVARILILEKRLFRLSEGAFLNDTSEGKELFKFLNLNYSKETDPNSDSKPFTQKPFIGSFVAENKHNDLTLWRMYGKENMEEAKGCSITIQMDQFIDSIKNEIIKKTDSEVPSAIGEEFTFYRVAYCKNCERDQFIINDANKEELNNFNLLMEELSEKIKNYISKKDSEIQILIERLNEIAYLFKSAEYQHENELRLVLNGVGFDKKIDTLLTPSRVYIELVPISPLISKITLGPKVERADEWAAAFYYSLDKEDLDSIEEDSHPEINISRLPFK